MGFTNIAWESRSAVRLARDLTGGPGPVSIGQAGASWVRVADEWASIAEEFDKALEKIKSSFTSRSADVVTRRLDDFSQWLRSVSVSAAANGQRAEEAAVAYGVAVLAMPSVAEAIQAHTVHDVMASLAAYNGAILNGQFAEFDEAVTAHDATASAVMYQYEEACSALAAPTPQPISPDVSNGAALKDEQNMKADSEHNGRGAPDGGGSGGAVVAPLAPFRAAEVKSSGNSKAAGRAGSGAAASGMGGVGSGGYGPMTAAPRGTAQQREHHTSLAGNLDGSGEPGAGVSDANPSWLPAAHHSDEPFTISHTSWGSSGSVFDEIAEPVGPQPPQYADAEQPTLEQVSNRWVSPPVIGVDKGLTL